MCIGLLGWSQTVTIGAGVNTGTTGSNAGPIYRSSAGSAFDFSQHVYLYTAAELSAAGILPGSTITSLAWNKSNAFGTAATNLTSIWRVYMKNSATVPSATWSSGTFSTQMSGATLVYNNTAQVIPAAIGYLTLTFSTPFVYTGGSLEIGSDWDCSIFAGSPATGGFAWRSDNVTNAVFGGSNSAAAITMFLQTIRPQMQLTYTPPTPCAGMPNPGNTTSSSASACSGINFTLGLQTAQTGTGITYQWQSSPDGITPYGDILGATSGNLVVSQTAATYYQCVVTCTNTFDVAISTPLQVTMSPFYNCYCVGTTTNGCGSGDHVTNVTFNAAINPINNTTAACISGGSYSDYRSLAPTASVQQTNGVPISVSVANGGTEYAGAWLDADANGSFDATEYTTLTDADGVAPWVYNGIVNVPLTAQLGLTGLRVRSSYNAAILDNSACATYSYGETEDYLVNITAAPACAAPSGLTGSATSQTTGSMNWTTNGSTDYNYELRISGAAGSGPSGLIASGTVASGPVNFTSLLPNTTYTVYVQSNCVGPVTSLWSPGTTFFTGYCTAATSFTGQYISNFVTTGGLANISNNSNALASGGYADYTAQSVSQVAGSPVNFTISMAAGTYGAGIWVDWNGDLDFNDVDEAVYNSAAYGNPWSGSFSVPGGQALGNYRMRVRVDYFSGTPVPCGTISYGEAEDYTFSVVTPPSCFPPVSLAAPTIGVTTASLSWAAPAIPPAVGYEWELRTSGAGGSGLVGLTDAGATAGTTASSTLLTGSTSYSLYVRSDCGAGDYSVWAGPFTFLSGTPGQIGSGTGTNTFLPIYSCYGYNYSQQIYLASEYNTPANSMIEKIRFYYDNGGTPVTNWTDWVVYMANTAKTDFTSTTDWVSTAAMSQVFSGVVTPVAGNWMEITLNTPFIWDGSSNILVAVDENTPVYSCTAQWRSYTATGNRGILFYSDGTNPDPNAPPTANYGPTSALSQIQLVGIPAPPCTTPTPGNTLSSLASACAGTSFTLSLQNPSFGTGLSFQWQSSPDGIAPYTDILGAMGSTYTTTMTGSAYYQCNVTCSTGPVTVASAPIQVTQTPGINCYCVPVTTAGCTDGDVIARVTLNTLDNNSGTGCPSGVGGNGYSDYTATAPAPPNTYTTTLQAGTSYGCTVYAGQYPEGYAAWIDYNDDGLFAGSERIGYSIGQVAGSGQVGVLGSSATFPIVLLCNPPLGTHRLRVRCMYFTNGIDVTPCTANTFGETEDYLVTISAADPCPAPINLGVTNVTANSADLTWTLGCAETVWDLQVQAFGAGAPVGSGTNPGLTSTTFTASGLIPGNTYEYYVRANCGGLAGESAWAGPFAFAPPPLNDLCTGVTIQTVGANGSITFNGNSTGALDTEGLGAKVAWEAFTLTDCVPSLEVSWCGSNPARTIAFTNLFTSCPFNTTPFIAATSVLNDCANGGRRHLYTNLQPGTYYIAISEQAGGSGPYSITVNPGPACPVPSCVTTPTPADNAGACPGINGIVLSWPAVQYATSYEVFVDGLSVGTQTGTTYNTGISSGAHTWQVVPSGSSGTAVGCPTWNFSTNSAIYCYCGSAATNTADEEIYSVSFNGTLHGGGAADCTVPATGAGSLLNRYANYRDLGALWNFTQGIPVPFDVAENECDGAPYYGFGTAIWVDLNQDGVFDDNTEKLFVETATATGPRNVIGNITVPFGATPGLTGMRVTVAENLSGASLTACLSYGYGETHDYLVNILQANNNFTCATAQPVSCFAIENSYITGTNSLPLSTCAFNGPAATGGTNWFVYYASTNEDITFSVCSPSIDVQVNAFKPSALDHCNSLVCVGGADDSPGCAPGADLKVKANAGDTIYIAVSGVTGVSGTYVFQVLCDVQCSPGVSNDMCANAQDLNPLPYVGFGAPIPGDNTCAYVDGPTGNSGAEPVQGLWYTFNSGVNSKIRMTLTPGSASNLKWALHSGTCNGLDANSEVANGNAGGVTTLNVTPATDYRLLVFNAGGPGVQGTFTLRVEVPGINDASISQVISPSGSICDTQFQPVVKLKNLGEATLTSAQIIVKVDATTVNTINWSGPALAYGDSVTLTLPLVSSTGSHVLNVNTNLPNGAADDIPSNDLASSPYQANGQTVKVRVTTDNNPGQTTWIIYAPGNVPVASGGPYILPNTQSTTTICLPVTGGNTKWYFFLFDSFGDGICCSAGTGSWQLLDKLDRVIIRDNGQFTTQSPTTPPLTPAYAVGHEINLPLGPSKPWTASPYNVCGVFNLGMQSKIRCTTVAGVTNYQWEFSNPDAGYQRRVTANTNFVTYVSMQAQQPQLGVTYFVRNRADQGVAGFADDNFGEGCELGWNNSNSQFCTGLVSTAGATFSCGATRTWGGSSKIWATPVVGAYPYDANGNGSFADAGDQQFAYHFRFVGAGGYIRDIYTATYICPLAWTTNPLLAGNTYQVTVETQAGGVWRGFCGSTCNLTIAAGPGQGAGRMDATAVTAENIELWPNPVRDGRVNLRVDGIVDADQRITVDIYDAFGKKVVAQQYANSGSLFNTVLNLDGGLAAGVYMVNITINDRTSLKRLTVL